MPRPPRHFEPDTLYHVTNRGVDRRMIFHRDEDRHYFLMRSLAVLNEAGCSLIAYCLMGNHFHLLIGVATTPLGVPMRRAMTAYAAAFNKVNERIGHLFESRFFSRPVFDPAYVHNVIAYIHRNPVEAGIVANVESWPWSSHSLWAAGKPGPLDWSRLTPMCGMTPTEVRDEYLRRVAFMASEAANGMSVEELLRDTAAMMGLDPERIRAGARGDAYSEARLTILHRAERAGHPDAEVARTLGCSKAAISLLRARHPSQVVNESV